jgi:membrane-associated protein
MELIRHGVDIFLHLDRHLNAVMQDYGVWTYALLFAIIFSETGFVVTPFLPGDSLLFAAGALSATAGSPLGAGWLFVLLTIAAVAGNTTNYSVGRYFGDKLLARYPRIIKPEHLEKTHAFFEKYGGQTIIITRFVPLVRTFAPFVAGAGHMTYLKFTAYNVAGGVLWVGLFIYGGYFFGNLPVVKSNFSIVIVAIIILSVMPMVIEFLRARKKV